MKLFIDTETYSETPIQWGTYRYVQDSECMIVTWAIDDGEVQGWDLTAEYGTWPVTLCEALLNADEIIAHNAMFDRLVINTHTHLDVPLEKWRCSMVKAMAHSLPGGLGVLCDILNVPQAEGKHDGKKLVQLFCKPRPKNSKVRRATRETNPEEWQAFIDYAKADISAMRAVYNRLPSWNYAGAELALWHLDQRINDRGFKVDEELVAAALHAVSTEKSRLTGHTHDITDGELTSVTQRDPLFEYILTEYRVSLPDLKAATLERRLADPDIPDGLKELLRVRLQVTTTSTSKYKALTRGTTQDGRLHGTLQFNGAGRTGRWSGRTFQPQNLPSRGLLPAGEISTGIEAMKAGVAHLCFDNVMHLASSAIRGCIVAPKGKKLVIADLSNIEGRILAWLAGEEWKLQAFRDFDNGTGADLYKLAYAKSFKIKPEDVTKAERQVGKVMELAMGYEGGVGAFLTFSLAYGIDLEEMAAGAIATLPDDIYRDASGFYDWSVKQNRSTFSLSKEAFIVCDAFKRLWRFAHPMVSTMWKELEAAAVEAVEHPGVTIHCRMFKVRRDGAWLRIGLPSGRALCYPQPQVEDGKLSYMGINQYTRQWGRIKTYGGKLVENCTQAVARDVMAANMQRIEDVGFAITLTVHDEIITEAPDEEMFNVGLLSDLMTTPNAWHAGLPLAAAGFEDYRYRKD